MKYLWMTVSVLAASLGGFLASRIGIPLPWMIGALFAVAALGMMGASVAIGAHLRNGGIITIMTALGLAFTPETGVRALALAPVMVFASLATLLIGLLNARLLARLANIDLTTAFFAAVPGGPMEMSMLGSVYGASAPEIALSQLLRIVTLVVAIPTLLTLGDATGDVVLNSSLIPFDAWGLVLTIGLSYAVGAVLIRMRVSAALLIGSLGVGMVLGVSEANLSSFPPAVINAAQVLTGAYLGSKFKRDQILSMRRFLPAAVICVAVLTVACAAFGAALGAATGLGIPMMILATAPGSVTEMAVTAKVLHFDAPTITAFHVLRIFIIMGSMPLIFALLRRTPYFSSAEISRQNPAE